MLNVYLFLDFLIIIPLVALMVMSIHGGGYKKPLNRYFALLALAVTFWLPANHIGNDIGIEPDLAVIFNYIVFSAGFVVVMSLAKIIILVAKLPPESYMLSILEWFLWPFAVLSATPLVGQGIEKQDVVNAVVFGPLGLPYGLLLLVLLLLTMETIIRGIIVQRGLVRRQLLSIGLTVLFIEPLIIFVGMVLPAMTNMFVLTDFSVLPSALIVASIYYSVVQHRLFDVKLAVIRTVSYLFSILIMAVIYILLAYGISFFLFRGEFTSGIGLSPANILLALTIAFIFQPIKNFFDNLTNDLFYKSTYDSEEFFRNFGKIVSKNPEIRSLLHQVSEYIATNLKSEKVFFYINDYGLFRRNRFEKTTISDQELQNIFEYYTSHHDILDVIVLRFIDNEETLKIFKKHKLQMILPLVLGGQAVGYLFVGDHKSGGYAVRDINTLEYISNELTVAIQNALSIEKIRELNKTLQSRIDKATLELRTSNRQLQALDVAKDEFISMASHQLRTPLTSIKGYLDMVLQGDLGKITPKQRQALYEAFLSSERMVSLVGDFLNISRLQTGKFVMEKKPTNLLHLIKEQLSMLEVVAAQHELSLKEEFCDHIPSLDIDAEKIQQVILNLIDNAIYYSRPNRPVIIKLDCEDGGVAFRVIDTGIGVPKKAQKTLFTKFFRAANARQQRPDGTGVGLFLVKKVIEAHDGKIIFESEEGKGSTFGFWLPKKEGK